MKRHRKIAGSPQRTTSETWQTIADLIARSLEPSDHIQQEEIEHVLGTVAPLAKRYIGAGHLEAEPLAMVAGDLWVEFTCVSGGDALTLEENLNVIPGAKSADEWCLHFPEVPMLEAEVKKISDDNDHVSLGLPTGGQTSASEKSSGSLLDKAALEAWARDS